MQTINVHLDREVFTRDTTLRAAHRHTSCFAIAVVSSATHWIVSLTPLDEGEIPIDIRERLTRDALDEQLRESVRNQTAGLQEALINAALSGAKAAPAEQQI